MSKYYLVASYYNLRTNNYEKETIIDSLEGINLNTLYNIDSFTSSHNKLDILNLIEKEKEKQGLNHLAIMYLKNKNSSPVYYRVIDNDQKFKECIEESDISINKILGKSKKTIYINRNNELYRSELRKLLDIINKRDYKLFKSIYPYDNDLSFLVKRYLTTSYDTRDVELEDYYQILVEFSRYKTFRGWYMNQNKLRNNISIKPKTNNDNSSLKEQKIEVISILEHEKEYERKFESDNGVSYSSFNTNKYNMDNEEFLDEDEYMSMQDDYDDKKIKRH